MGTRLRSNSPAYHHGNLRQSLIEMAEQLLHEKGPGALNLRAVARQAGVSHTALYRHFSSKDELLLAIAQKGFEKLAAAAADDVARKNNRDAAAKLADIAAAYVKFACEHPNQYRLMFTQVNVDGERKPAHQLAHQDLSAAIGAIQQGQRDGVIDPSADPYELAMYVWVAVHGLTVLLIDDQLVAAPFPHIEKTNIDRITHMVGRIVELLVNGAQPQDRPAAGRRSRQD